MSLLRKAELFLWADSLPSLTRSFISLLRKIEGGPNEALELAAAYLLDAVQSGDVCLLLADDSLPEGKPGLLPPPAPARWRDSLLQSRCVGLPGELAPLILDDQNRLYLYRSWLAEHQVATEILARAASEMRSMDEADFRPRLDRLFPLSPPGETDWQRVAAALACAKPFAVITGGPGTGKTSIVVKVLALLQDGRGADAEQSRILLAAPTGKAAVRLSEAISAAKAALDVDASLRERIPHHVQTLHRILGARPDGSFRHGAHNRLACDLLVLDEASMVDLNLMHALLEALPKKARLLMLGDRHQLCSVEAGSVLGDLSAAGASAAFSGELGQWLHRVARLPETDCAEGEGRLSDCVIELQKSYRFRADGGIGLVSRCVNEGNVTTALAALKESPECSLEQVQGRVVADARFRERVTAGFGTYLQARSAAEAVETFSSFMVLCALRRGPSGVETLSRAIEQMLETAGLLKRQGRWFLGQPLMVLRNDPHLNLFNGDIGILWPDQDRGGELRAFFPGEKGLISLSPSRLPETETVFAMTVHKSQGSEFDEVCFVLPEIPSPVFSRELIYTALTRAKRQATLWGSEEIFVQGVSRKVTRQSGLADALRGASRGSL